MLKDLRIIFTKEEKTLENLNKVLELLGDDSYEQYDKETFVNGHASILGYSCLYSEYVSLVSTTEDVLTLTEFLEKYDNKEIKQVVDNPDVNSFVDRHFANVANNKLTEMKELYESEPDKWILYAWNTKNVKLGWFKQEFPTWSSHLKYVLVDKKDEIVADAVIANPDVEVEYNFQSNDNGWTKTEHFFSIYNHIGKYQLAKPQCDGKFNCGYIKASQETYDLLVEAGYNKSTQVEDDGIDLALCFEVANNTIIQTRLDLPPKQFYINNGALSWDEPKTPLDYESIGKSVAEKMKNDRMEWDGCIIKASKESYELLSKISLKMSERTKGLIDNPLGYYEIRDGIALCMTTTCIDKPNEVFIKDGELVKQKPKTHYTYEIVEGSETIGELISETYTTKNAIDMTGYIDHPENMNKPTSANNAQVEATISKTETVDELMDKCDVLKSVRDKDTISIKDDNGKEYKFEKLDNIHRDIEKFFIAKWSATPMIFGYIINSAIGQVPIMWNAETGEIWDSGRLNLEVAKEKYNLTPIKPKWDEDKANFPALIYSEYNEIFYIANNKDDIPRLSDRLATQKEVNSLYYEGKSAIKDS